MAAFRKPTAEGDAARPLPDGPRRPRRASAQDKAIRRVDDLLAEREVDFGDGYTRNGLEAFSADAALQCMPLDVSPLVVYYNPKLIELDQIAEPGRNPVTQEDGWSLEEFARAARAAPPAGRPRPPRRPRPRAGRARSSGPAAARSSTTPTSPTTLTLSDGPSAERAWRSCSSSCATRR